MYQPTYHTDPKNIATETTLLEQRERKSKKNMNLKMAMMTRKTAGSMAR
jgi:hypothetical protein